MWAEKRNQALIVTLPLVALGVLGFSLRDSATELDDGDGVTRAEVASGDTVGAQVEELESPERPSAEERETAAEEVTVEAPEPVQAPSLAIDSKPSIAELRETVQLLNKDYRSRLKMATREQLRDGRAFASSTNPVDASMAKPREYDGEFYISRSDGNGHHLLRFEESEYPELFAVRQRRQSMQILLDKMEKESREIEFIIPGHSSSTK